MAQTQASFELSRVPRTHTRTSLDVDALVTCFEHP